MLDKMELIVLYLKRSKDTVLVLIFFIRTISPKGGN